MRIVSSRGPRKSWSDSKEVQHTCLLTGLLAVYMTGLRSFVDDGERLPRLRQLMFVLCGRSLFQRLNITIYSRPMTNAVTMGWALGRLGKVQGAPEFQAKIFF